MILRQDGSIWTTPILLRGVASRDVGYHFLRTIPCGAKAASAGTGFSIVLMQDNSVWGTGMNSNGQLGDETKASKSAFFYVQTIIGAKNVAAGGYHSLVMTEEGDVWATGWNSFGQLGDGNTQDRKKFFRVISCGVGRKVVAVAAGEIHSMVLMQDGSVWATGRNDSGQLGDGSGIDSKTFVKVMSTGAADVVAGGYHSMVLKHDGSVWTTGWNKYGQLGDGTKSDTRNYVQVVLSGAKAIAAGNQHSMVLQQDGSVWTAGQHLYGQLGDGTKMDNLVFLRVISNGVKAIAAGAFHSMVLKEDDSIWATGSNEDGQFGDGSTKSQKVFVRLTPYKTQQQNGAERARFPYGFCLRKSVHFPCCISRSSIFLFIYQSNSSQYLNSFSI